MKQTKRRKVPGLGMILFCWTLLQINTFISSALTVKSKTTIQVINAMRQRSALKDGLEDICLEIRLLSYC